MLRSIELRRLFRKKIPLLIIFLTFFLVVFNRSQLSSVQLNIINNDLDTLYRYVDSASSRILEEILEINQEDYNEASEYVYELAEEHEMPYHGELKELNPTIKLLPLNNAELFNRLDELKEAYSIEFDDNAQNDYDYAKLVVNHIDSNMQSNPDYQLNGAIDQLIKSDWVLFGAIPICLFIILAVIVQGEPRKSKNQYFHQLLPISPYRVLLERWMSLTLLSLFYVAMILVSSFIVNQLLGNGVVDWQYPYRLTSESLAYIPAYQVLLQLFLVFLLKVQLFMVSTLLLASVTKNINIYQYVMPFVIGVMSLLTMYSPQL